jgi:hypothetical protein
MNPIHLLVILHWQGQEIAVTLSRFPGSIVWSIVEDICQRQGLSADGLWAVQLDGRLLRMEDSLAEAIPDLEKRPGVVLVMARPVEDTDQSNSERIPPEEGEDERDSEFELALEDEFDDDEDFDDMALDDEEFDDDDFEDEDEEEPLPVSAPVPEGPVTAAFPVPVTIVAPPPGAAIPARASLPVAATGQAAPPKESRQATVRYFSRMNPENTYPLLVVLSKKEIREIVKKAVKQATSKRFEVAKDLPVEIEPVLPGCDCYPPVRRVSLTANEVSARFFVVPRVLGRLSEPHVVVRQGGQELAEVPLDIKVVKQSATVALGALSLCLPLVSTVMQHYKMDFASQLQDGFPLYAQVAQILLNSLSPELLGLVLLCLTVTLYLIRRPRQREVFWDVEPLGPKEERKPAQQQE